MNSPPRRWLWLLLALVVFAYLATLPSRLRWSRERAARAAAVGQHGAQPEPPASDPAAMSAAAAHARLDQLERQLRGGPDDAALYLQMAPLYDALGQEKQSLYVLEAARRAAPNAAEVAEATGGAYLSRRAYDRAIDEWRRALGLEPGRTSVALQLASLYTSLGWTPEAGSLLDQARRHAPKDPGVLIAMAMHAIQSGDARQAEAFLRQARSLAPDDPRIESLLANVYEMEGARVEALKAIQIALSRDAEEPDFLIQQGDLLLAGGDPSSVRQAEAAYRQALARAPRDPRAGIGLGRCLRRQGRLDEAAASLAPLQAMAHPEPSALRELGQDFIRLGRADEGRAVQARADRIEQQAATLSRAQLRAVMRPGEPGPRRELAMLYLQLGDAPHAIVELKRLLAQLPHDAAGRKLLARALRAAGRAEEAG